MASSERTPEPTTSSPQRPADPTECVVHQLLDRQRRRLDESASPAETPPLASDALWRHQRSSLQARGAQVPAGGPVEEGSGPAADAAADAGRRLGATTPVDQGHMRRPGTAPARTHASVCPFGQADEQKWTDEMMSSKSRVEMGFPTDEDHHGGEHTCSRLLTKKQLNEMAWGVRELGRRLGSMRIRFAVRTIFVLTKIHDHELVYKTRELARWLLAAERDTRYVVYVENSLRDDRDFDAPGLLAEVHRTYVEAGELPGDGPNGGGAATTGKRLRYWSADMCRTSPQAFDFVVTLGGDGTVLFASWLFQRMVPPVLSFALGSLGFLTKFDFNDYQAIMANAFSDGVTIGLRLRFEGTVMRSRAHGLADGTAGPFDGRHEDGQEPYGPHGDGRQRQRDLVEELIGEGRGESTHSSDVTYEILNEIVVDRGPNPTLSYLEIFGDDEHFTSVLADGICVSTPTGSTAYNLAAGGSLCHPENPVMLVTSICAHTLSFRPIILPDTIVLRVGVPYKARTGSWVSFDGRERVELFAGDYVTISASRYPFAGVQADGKRSEDWVNGISAKLGWNTRQLQREYTHHA